MFPYLAGLPPSIEREYAADAVVADHPLLATHRTKLPTVRVMGLLRAIDSLTEKADRRMRRTAFYQPEISASREVIGEDPGRTREEIDQDLAELGLPSVMENGKAFVKSLPVLVPLVVGLAALSSIRRFFVRRQQ